MSELLQYLWYLPTPIMLFVGLFILLRYRHRSRKATGIALVALCGLTGLWLVGHIMFFVWRNWNSELPDGPTIEVLRAYSLINRCLEACCIVLLVIATVIDRERQLPDVRTGPMADFDDSKRSPDRS